MSCEENPFQDKYFVFIASTGRTGTRYFGETLCNIISNSFSVHEPDVFVPGRGFSDAWRKLRLFGIHQFLLGKLTARTGIRNLSQNYLAGKLDLNQLAKQIAAHRRAYYQTIFEDLIIESYSGWYGSLLGIKQLYRNHKIVVVVRDPKAWLTSAMNTRTLFGARDWVSKLGLERLSPNLIGDYGFTDKWTTYNRFQKLCWTYKTQYELMLDCIEGDPNCRLQKFEDIFISNERYDNLHELIAFITSFPDRRFEYTIPKGVLEVKIHANTEQHFLGPQSWSDETNQQFEEICGPTARRLGY